MMASGAKSAIHDFTAAPWVAALVLLPLLFEPLADALELEVEPLV